MSRSKENGEQLPADFDYPDGQEQTETPEQPGNQDVSEEPAGQVPPEEGMEPGLRTIEEHAEKLKVSKPVFAAVKQEEGWAAGKKVTETAFKAAMDTFLKAPMDGKERPPESGKQEIPEGDKR